MGRLFWKLFLFIWLGQMAAVSGTAALFWAERHGLVARLDAGPPHPPSANHKHPPPWPADGEPPRREQSSRPPHGPPGMHLPVWPIVAGCLASLLCAAGLAWYFARPIRRLRQGFEALAKGDLTVRVMPGGGRGDDLADLGHDFDHMAGRMQVLVEGQKRLLHDVSHELRSPLARLQAAVGLARQQPARIDDSMTRIERECDRMNRLIGELLTLSRLEAGSPSMLREVDMDELMADLVDDARFEGMDRQVGVDYVAGKMAKVMGDPELLHRAIENVVRNALRYSPPGATIRIEAGLVAPGMFAISVLDQGPGVGEQNLDAIFTPFFRGDAELNQDGYGLGLTIARQVLLAAGGDIVASNAPGAGLHVRLEMPVSSH